MKKIISILLVLLVVLSFAPIALADEETNGDEDAVEVDAETQKEIEAMDSLSGAEVRLLQLESAIARNIERGNEVIAKATDLEKDVSGLEAILSEMKVLKDEVSAADPSAEDAVQVFVDLKKDAIDLSKEFRDKAREVIPSNEANMLKERIRNENIGEQTELKERIRERLKEFNSQRLGAMFQKMGMEDQELIEKIKNGEITVKEVKVKTMERFKSMTAEEKKNAFSAAKETGVKMAVTARANADKIKAEYIERKETRLTQRLDKLESTGKKTESLIKYKEERLQKLEETKTRIQSKVEQKEQKTEEIKERKEEMQQNKILTATQVKSQTASQVQQKQQTGANAGGSE